MVELVEDVVDVEVVAAFTVVEVDELELVELGSVLVVVEPKLVPSSLG